MEKTRLERDGLGEIAVPADALYGAHTARAAANFPLSGRRMNQSRIRALAMVKLAAARTNEKLGLLASDKFAAISRACEEMAAGALSASVIPDALQGGAGTSANMCVNEVLCNRALQLMGKTPGDYETLDPIRDLNMSQSTNDVYPTALKVAAILDLRKLERAVTELLEAFQAKEREFADVVKVGRTQLQDAALTTLGREMGAYADALARDRWRVYKCEERLRVVNLGGTAIGTGITAPREYIFAVVDELRQITGIGLSRAENLVDATQNADAFVEVSGILKALATTLYKSANDLRLLSSGPDAGIGEVKLPPRQAGSSIMPGKVNPVIPEAVMQAAMVCFADDFALTMAAANGSLELNPFMPLIADRLLSSIALLTTACEIYARACVAGIQADAKVCARNAESSIASITALVEEIGYAKAEEIAHTARREGLTPREAALKLGFVTAEKFDELIDPQRVNMLGRRLKKDAK